MITTIIMVIIKVLKVFGIDINSGYTALLAKVAELRRDKRYEDIRTVLTHYLCARKGIVVPRITDKINIIPRSVWLRSGKQLIRPFAYSWKQLVYILEGPREPRLYYSSRWYLADKRMLSNALFAYAEKNEAGEYVITDLTFQFFGRIADNAYVQHKHIRHLKPFDMIGGEARTTDVAVDYLTKSTYKWMYGYKHRNGVSEPNFPELMCYRRTGKLVEDEDGHKHWTFDAFVPNYGYPHESMAYSNEDFMPTMARFVGVMEYEGDVPSIAQEMEEHGFECLVPKDGHLEAMVNGRNYTMDFSRAALDLDAAVQNIIENDNIELLEAINFNIYEHAPQDEPHEVKKALRTYCVEHAIDFIE